MRAEGALAVVESAYRIDLGEGEWLSGLAEAARKGLDAGFGVSAWICLPRIDSCRIRRFAIAPRNDALEAAAMATVAGVPDALNAALHRTITVGTASEEARARGLPYEALDALQGPLLPFGIADTLNVQAADPSGVTALLTVPLAERADVHPRVRHAWWRVAVHMSAGLRLREMLGEDLGLERGEALLDAEGRVVHATGAARSRSGRERLRAAALAVDRARSRRGASEPEEALELWRGLFAGRWTVLERFDTDGRRFMVAYRNEPEVVEDRALTRREQQVAALAALGHGDDSIAYSLGLGVSTVRTHLRRALGKLGLPSRQALVEVAAVIGLAPDPPPPGIASLSAAFRRTEEP